MSNPYIQSDEIDENGPGEFENVKFRGSFIKVPTLTFFYERPDLMVFAAEEEEAATQKYNSKFKFLGWSTGEAYNTVLRECGLKVGQIIPKTQAEDLLKKAFNAELESAKLNLENARKEGRPIPRPIRAEWAFDGSVPEAERQLLSKGRYTQARQVDTP